jgi:hypothetical protein
MGPDALDATPAPTGGRLTYTPIPDSVAGKALAYLRSVHPQRIGSADLGAAIGVDGMFGLHASLRHAVRHGLICRQAVSPKRVLWWASDDRAFIHAPEPIGLPAKRGFGTDAPGRELAEVWGRVA